MANSQKGYKRFSLAQRIEHWIMAISFTTLMITGLPQRYALQNWAEISLTTMGGVEAVRVIHRIAAVVFIAVMIYHFLVVAYKIFVLRVRLTMMPTMGDVKDTIDTIRYYLRLTSDHPKLPRYNFAEKAEYWAVIWGGVLMTITGFVLWNPIATTNLLPGEFIPAARAAHSAEAWLAFLAIIIWHFYWVHLKTLNRSMFNGRLSREQMALEHAAELEEIDSGQAPPPPSPTVVSRRERIFMPVAGVILVVAMLGLYLFVTFEDTAITTLPPGERAVAFAPATPTPTSTPLPTPVPDAERPAPTAVPIIPHPLGGREECRECHGLEGPLPYPENHEQYTLEDCLVCHGLEQERPAPQPVSHSLVEREQCKTCHQPDLLPETHQEADFSNRKCLVCHPIPDESD